MSALQVGINVSCHYLPYLPVTTPYSLSCSFDSSYSIFLTVTQLNYILISKCQGLVI
jgi:hypothetical protein